MPFPIVPAPSTATVLISARFKKPPERTPVATETQDKQKRQGAESMSRSLERFSEGGSKASQAAIVANFSAWDEGEPKGRPSSVTRLIRAGRLSRGTKPPWSR